MTMITVCADCKNRVSAKAVSCVHCGAPFQIAGPNWFGYMIRVLAAGVTLFLLVIALQSTGGQIPVMLLWILVMVTIGVCCGIFYATRAMTHVKIWNAIEEAHAPSEK